jgi:hypothetical protein
VFRETRQSSRIRAHLRNNVIGYVALFVALSTGTAYATHPGGTNTISTDDIIDGEVRQPDIQNGAITTADISNSNGVRSEDVLDDTDPLGGLAAVDLGPASVGSSELAPGAVGSGAVQDGSLVGADLANLAVGAAQLADGAVTNSKLGTFSVSNSKIITSAVTSNKIATSAVTQSDIATDGVAGAEIVNSSVRSEDINADAVGARALRPIVTRVANVTVFGGAAAPAVATATCNADEVVIGGGADWEFTGYHTRIIESRRSGNGWRIEGYYGDGPSLAEDPDRIGLEAEAYCLPL